MALRRSEVTRTRMLRLLLRYPPMTLATLARIYANALRLRLRGAPVHPHPPARDEPALEQPAGSGSARTLAGAARAADAR
jgi:DUF1365 family protein